MEKITNDEFKVTLRNDYAFKRAFGDEKNKVAVIDFLSCVLWIFPLRKLLIFSFWTRNYPRIIFRIKREFLM